MKRDDPVERKCSRCSAWFATPLTSLDIHCPICSERMRGYDPIRYWERWQSLSGYRGTGHAPFPPLPALCAIADCWRHSTYEGGMCPAHQARQSRYGNSYPLVPVTPNGRVLRAVLEGER